jgi:2,3-bisphosphoglycerate-dependent phosphoglycerate mutase
MATIKKITFLSLLFFAFLFTGYQAKAQTTIWIIRHAEKGATGTDPDLSPMGAQRADDLLQKLKHEKLDAIWVTKYKRTLQTVEFISDKAKVKPTVYDPADATFAGKLLQDYKDKGVLVVGHSNTILPLIAALGAGKPFDALTDDDYDLLFKVTVDKDGKATLKISYYGDVHHTTPIPEKYN